MILMGIYKRDIMPYDPFTEIQTLQSELDPKILISRVQQSSERTENQNQKHS
jgi:hypothetical protein